MTLAGGSTNGQVLVNFRRNSIRTSFINMNIIGFLTPIFLHIGLEHILFNNVFYMIVAVRWNMKLVTGDSLWYLLSESWKPG